MAAPSLGHYASLSFVVRGRCQVSGGGRQRTEGRSQRSEVRGQRSGIKPISDLRLLTSVIDDFNDFNDFNDLASQLIFHLTKGFLWLTNSEEKLYL